MKIKNAIILAAGSSSRFGENKLHKKINGLTLPQRILKFCIKNEITQIYVTIRKEDFYIKNHKELCHPIIEDLQRHELYTEPFNGFPGIVGAVQIKNLVMHYAFQNPDEYGPAAGLKVWKDVINEPTIVFFGDNFYNMELPDFDFKIGNDTVFYTYVKKSQNPRNLQLAAVVDNYIIEKPHPFLKGNYFCGYIVFQPEGFKHIDEINKSGRNEYEITDFINSFEDRQSIWVNDSEWADLTYQKDIKKIEAMIK